MTRSQSDSWSMMRSLAFLAATFAIVLGALLPAGAMAAARPGQVMLCSDVARMAAGSDEDNPGGKIEPGHCPACVMPIVGALPNPPVQQAAQTPDAGPAALWTPGPAGPPPPARAPPRPPSTAPPQA